MELEIGQAVGVVIPRILEWGITVTLLFALVVVEGIFIWILYKRNVFVGDEMLNALKDNTKVFTEVRDAVRSKPTNP